MPLQIAASSLVLSPTKWRPIESYWERKRDGGEGEGSTSTTWCIAVDTERASAERTPETCHLRAQLFAAVRTAKVKEFAGRKAQTDSTRDNINDFQVGFKVGEKIRQVPLRYRMNF